MNEATWVIIAGLCFDIGGAFLIIKPLLYIFTEHWGHKDPRKDKGSELGLLDLNQKADDEKAQKFSRIGLVLLVTGFILQIIGNWVLKPPIVDPYTRRRFGSS